jgi:hypothetical protein
MTRNLERRAGFRFPRATLACVAVLAAALALPRPGVAQQVAFPTVPWGASPTAVAAAIQQLGFTLDSMELTGLPFAEFSAGSTRLVATFGPSGLAMLNQIHPLPPPLARRRLEELRDSVVRVLGEPDSAGARPKWIRPDGYLQLFVRPDSAGLSSAAVLNRASPSWVAELRASYREAIRRAEADPVRWIEARLDTMRWHPLVPGDSMVVSVDKTGVERRSGDTWRVRTRRDYRVPVAAAGHSYDTIAQRVEIGCAEGTFRPGESISVLAERNPRLLTTGWGARSRPAPPSLEQAIVSAFCAYARGLQ